MTNNHVANLKNVLILSGVVLIVMVLISSYAWTQIPAGEQVCTHWNAAGECDQYGGKFMGIFLLPIIAAAIVGLLAVLPRLEPRTTNMAQSFSAYIVVWRVVLLFFLLLHLVLMLSILGVGVNIGTVLPILIGCLFILIGNYLGKVRSNFFFGIRTPWTLSSDLAWNKTHRLGGKLFVLLGLLFIASAILFQGSAWIFWLVGSTLAMVVVLSIYSYYIWKDDPSALAR